MTVPDPVRCRFLIDTGASATLVKHEFAERAGLKLINNNSLVRGIGQDDSGRTYLGRIIFTRASTVQPGVVQQVSVQAEIASANLEHGEIDGLIGRDVLNHFNLHYGGASGEVTMTFLKPPGSAPQQ